VEPRLLGIMGNHLVIRPETDRLYIFLMITPLTIPSAAYCGLGMAIYAVAFWPELRRKTLFWHKDQ
jgi:hypothetical protein